jgi:hypothetical protein
MLISQAYASPNHNARTEAISAIVVHSCEGSPAGNEEQSSIPWLCNPASEVSCHYYVTRAGRIYQLVGEERRAWHAGICSIADDTNSVSIGIELEHRRGSAPYPVEQIGALTWLCEDIRKRYPIPLDRVVRHGTVALPRGRRTDPTDWSEPAFRAWVATLEPPPAATSYTELSPILGRPLTTHATMRVPASSQYNQAEVNSFIDAYWNLALTVGIDPILAIAQMCHETGYLTSWWCQRPRRNPAGIGVTGETEASPTQPRGEWALHPDGLWHKGVSYRTWLLDAIPDHVGRLLGYTLPAGTGTTAQQTLIQRSNARRPIDLRIRGSAQNIKQLGAVHNPSGLGWAKPGVNYGARIAKIANRLIGYAP